MAQGSRFNTDCLAAPPGQAFTIAFDNTDGGIVHDVLISDAFNPGATTLFDGRNVKGPATITYNVRALAAGTYSFECSLHPQVMHGTLIISTGAPASTAATP